MTRQLLLLCAALAFVMACSSGLSGAHSSAGTSTLTPPTGQSVDSACPPAGTRAAVDSTLTLESGGVQRRYELHVPGSYDGTRPVPLVVAFHPYGGDAASFAAHANFPPASDGSGAIVVAPDALGSPQFWNIAKYAAAADDVTFVRDLLARIEGELCIDPDRIYAAGYSNGGGMAMRAACEMPDKFAAIGVVAGTYIRDCQASVPIIAFHGMADQSVAFDGGTDADSGIPYPPIRRSVSEWALALGCDALPRISRAAAHIELSTFVHCRYGDGDALLYSVIGGGHTWPGAIPALPEASAGVTTTEIAATPLMWEFFAAHPHSH